MKRIVVLALAALAVVPTAASAAPYLSASEAHNRMRHLVVHKTRGVVRSSIAISDCHRKSAVRFVCALGFRDGQAYWSGHVSTTVKPNGHVVSKYRVYN